MIDHRKLAWEFVSRWYAGPRKGFLRDLEKLGRWDCALVVASMIEQLDDTGRIAFVETMTCRAEKEADALQQAQAEIAKLKAERDAVISMCILHYVDTGERWSFVGDFGKVPFVSMIKSMSHEEAVVVVRRAAGLDHDTMTDDEVRVELERRGIDTSKAMERVREALQQASSKYPNGGAAMPL
jgi:hypothetical protein